MKLNRAGILRFKAYLFRNSARPPTDMEGAHRELGAGFTDRLCRNYAHRFTDLDKFSRRQVAAIAPDASATPGFACEYRANLDALDSRRLDRAGKVLSNFLIDLDDHLAFVVLDFLQRHPADNTIAQRLDNFSRLDDRPDIDSIHGAAIALADDHILGHVNESPGQIARVGCFESRVRQSLSSTVRRDEVLLHSQAFSEIRGDRRFDDFARRLRHHSAHTG